MQVKLTDILLLIDEQITRANQDVNPDKALELVKLKERLQQTYRKQLSPATRLYTARAALVHETGMGLGEALANVSRHFMKNEVRHEALTNITVEIYRNTEERPNTWNPLIFEARALLNGPQKP